MKLDAHLLCGPWFEAKRQRLRIFFISDEEIELSICVYFYP